MSSKSDSSHACPSSSSQPVLRPDGPLVIQFAMRGEAAPLLDQLGFERGVPFVSGETYGFELHRKVLQSGRILWAAVAGIHPRDLVEQIGRVPAALLSHLVLSELSPRVLINAGTAGGFQRRGARIGDLFLGTKAVHHDRRIPLGQAFESFGAGHHTVLWQPEWLPRLGARAGIVSTGDSLDCSAEDAARLEGFGAEVKEMEAGAIAQVCEAHGTPLILLKAITDFVDHHEATQDQFLRNYRVAVDRLTEGLVGLVALLEEEFGGSGGISNVRPAL